MATRTIITTRRCAAFAATLLASTPIAGFGQAAAPGAPPQVEEIKVTASRSGSTNVQKIPLAVSVIKPEDLIKFGGSGLLDYAQTIPSITVQTEGAGISKIDIRGVVTSAVDITDVQDRPTVAVYLDETPISLQAQNPDLKVFDLQRIEVLRGPQGTLYGAGSMAGTIRLITQKPDATRYFGSIEGTVSDTTGGYGGANYSGRLMGNFPIINDKVAVRVVGYRSDDSGFIKNLGQHENNRDDIVNQARVAVRFTPNEKLSVDTSFTYADLNGGIYDAFKGLKPYEFTSLEPEYSKDRLKLWNVTANYDLDFATLINSASYMERDTNVVNANEYGVNAFLFGGAVPLSPAVDLVRNGVSDVVDELRLVSPSDQRLTWTGGFFYENFHRHYYQDQPFPGFDAQWQNVVAYPGYSSVDDGAFHANDDFSGYQNVHDNQKAVFGQVTFKVTPKLNVTAGLRYFDWNQDFKLYFGGVFGASPIALLGVPGVPLRETGTAAATGTTPRFALDYHFTDDKMVFLEAAKGFRYGGVNQPVPVSICEPYLLQNGLTAAPLKFGPDKLWSYSLGEKSSFFDNRMTFNLTAFLIQWSNAQTENLLACSYYYIQNKGNIQNNGIEAETTIRATDALTISGNATYTNAEANGAIPSINAGSGAQVPYTPKYNTSVTATYVIPLEANRLELSAQYNTRGTQTTTFNPYSISYRQIPGFQTVNLAANYFMGRWQVGLFANNIGSTEKIVDFFTQVLGTQQPGDAVFYARPMTIGLRVKTTF